MNKLSFLTLALVLALPGCCCRKKSEHPIKKNNIEKYFDANRSAELSGDEDEDDMSAYDIIEEEYDVSDLDDLDEDADNQDGDELSGEDSEEGDMDAAEQDGDELAWIDSQADDEFKTLYFSFNHYGIKADQKAALNYDIEQVKQLLADASTTAEPTIVIEGHTCQEGDRAYNVGLSEKRAKSVADFFVAAGIDRSAIKVVGRGQECPAVVNGKIVNGSREERALNRRVEVRVLYT